MIYLSQGIIVIDIVSFYRVDTLGIYPATFAAVKMRPTNVGSWLIVCRSNAHFHGNIFTSISTDTDLG